MDSRGQTSMEYLLIAAGSILLVVLLGYFLVDSAQSLHKELNDVNTDIFES